jgi:hypothetical protein
MKQPIPRNGTAPLKVGDRVQIVPEWQDLGDEKYERFVIEAPDDCARVRIQAVVPGIIIQPTEWIEAYKLVRVIDWGDLADLSPETAVEEHLDEFTREQRLFFVEKFPALILEALGDKMKPEEVELCVRLHPSIALRSANQHLTGPQLDELGESHPFATLLYASHRLGTSRLQVLATLHPCECIVILERLPESALMQSLLAIRSALPPQIAAAMARQQTP